MFDWRASVATQKLCKNLETTDEFETKIYKKYPVTIGEQRSLRALTDLKFGSRVEFVIMTQFFIFTIGFLFPMYKQIF